jgi:hypothetical protein
MTEFKNYLDAIDPRLFYLTIALAVGAVIFGWKKIHSESFYKVPTRYRALPAAVLGALVSGSSATEIKHAVIDAVIGVFAGVTAVGGHEFLSRLLSAPKVKAEEEKQE